MGPLFLVFLMPLIEGRLGRNHTIRQNSDTNTEAVCEFSCLYQGFHDCISSFYESKQKNDKNELKNGYERSRKIQTAAIKIDMAIRNKEKLYSFSGLNLS